MTDNQDFQATADQLTEKVRPLRSGASMEDLSREPDKARPSGSNDGEKS